MGDDDLEELFAELIAHQRKRVLEHARRLNPRLTEDDIQQPQDFPELYGNSEWQYEDGILAGYLAAQMAVRARRRRS
jgi:ferritin-like protein